ncbi:MAG: protein translocase subunit SecD [Chlamydiales bacterium]|nr:protein translocase subunit SecD [Chlamydiales bacterium]
MEKRKKWQTFLIVAVLALTIYNILPTIFFYSRPLKSPISEKEASRISGQIVERVNGLETFTLSWLKAQAKNIGAKTTSIAIDRDDPRLARVTFKKESDAQLFKQTLYRAGALIPFVPAQLSPVEVDDKTVVVQRRIGVHLDPNSLNEYFQFIPKMESGELSAPYRHLVGERVAEIAVSLGGESEASRVLQSITGSREDENEAIVRLARSIVEYENTFGDNSAITKRYFASFTAVDTKKDRASLVHSFVGRLEGVGKTLGSRIIKLEEEQKQLQKEGAFLDSAQQQRLEVFRNQKTMVDSALTILRRNSKAFEAGPKPLQRDAVIAKLESEKIPATKVQIVSLGERNPFVKQLEIDWSRDQVELVLHDDVSQLRAAQGRTEVAAMEKEKLNQLLFNEIALVSRTSDETVTPSVSDFVVTLNKLTNSSSLLVLDIGKIAQMQAETLATLLKDQWQREGGELGKANYPIAHYNPKGNPKLGLVIYAPAMEDKVVEGFRPGSLYVVAKGMAAIRQKYQELPDSTEKSAYEADFMKLQEIMRSNGFIGYAGKNSGLPAGHDDDYVFELDDYYSYLIAATREEFQVKGSKKFALLEFTNVEERMLTRNKIETRIQEDLVKWQDEYRQARVSIDPQTRFDVPKPTQNVLLSNLKLSTLKYFRGDERKILKWGLDLSGGKTVRIGLKDQNNVAITDENDLRQAVNELYQRVNRLGVSEVGIRTEGSNIVLDFPGSQALSASELIQSSAMYFNVVNEKFTRENPTLAEAVNTFLEEVWNEAVITNRTDTESLNEIAWQHLGGSLDHPDEFTPYTSHAKLLYENGLRLAGPRSAPRSSAFDDTLSAITRFRGSDYTDWQGQTYPLIIVFRNYALEGANLNDIQSGYDPKDGNTLYFGVKSSYVNSFGQKVNPRDAFYTWTSQFSEEKIAGTPKENYSRGRGWRMAVILNGSVITAPTLNASLRDSAHITGHFSQREVNSLVADLKAGSLSFTPQILSEENVSPDLGKEQRTQGIVAAALGLLLMAAIMCSVYRFSGVIACVAVIVNLLIIWGVLQNLGAALTLPGIAGIILSIGMSVDANVLVFERIREEFALSGRLPSAIAAGYRKAYSAIIDSNLTTILAAIILLNFDAGPIKGLALTLIIGILSSMFTALFMTRFFFAGWVQNPKHKVLKMVHLFKETKFDFLKKARVAIISALVVILVGGFFLIKERHSIFGMDFTGGYALSVDLQEQSGLAYRKEAEQALVKAGASSVDFQIQELNRPNQLRIQLGMGMEQQGGAFSDLSAVKVPENPLFAYQTYPRIVWIVNALEAQGLQLNPASLEDLNLHWTEMSGQLSETMRNQALFGLILALIGILIYITFRFEFKYAISATVAIAHDLLVTLGVLAILHAFFGVVQIDLQVIAALMTIVGYSLNDTIIIFDRIREDIRLMRKSRFVDVVNHALNATLSRTVMTSGTTLAVLLALVIFGGASILNFALIMTLGVAIGTFSSLFVAAPVLLYFHRKNEETEESVKKV